MTLAEVQSRSAEVTGSGGTSVALAFSANVTAGNSIIVQVIMYPDQTGYTVSDNQGGTYTKDASSGNGTTRTDFWSNPNAAGGATTITASGFSAGSFPTLIIHEASGTVTASIKDKSATNSGTTGTAHSTGTTATTTQASEILFAGECNDGSASTVSSGWTIAQSITNTAGTTGTAAYQIVSATGAYSCTFTGQNGQWTAAIVTYKGATGGTNVNVTVNVPSLTQTAQATSVRGDANVGANSTSLVMTPQAVSVRGDANVSVNALSMSMAAQAVTVSITGDVNVNVNSLSFSLAPQNVSVSTGSNVTVNALSLSMAPQAVAVSIDQNVAVNSLSMGLGIQPVSVSTSSNVNVALNALSLTMTPLAVAVNSVTIMGGGLSGLSGLSGLGSTH